jgi:hypothetical protein
MDPLFADEEAVVKISHNEKWKIGTVNTTKIPATFISNPDFRL